MYWTILQLFLLVLFPFVSRRMQRRNWLPSWLSPVVLCYALGIALGNFDFFPLDDPLSTAFSEYSIVLAIPLLLYNTRLREWISYAKSTLGSFALCVISGIMATSLAAFIYHEQMANSWQLAGMLAGIYTGGTPNMQAVGLALDATQETIILVNAADIFWGGIYLLFLTSLAPRIFGWILPYQEVSAPAATSDREQQMPASPYPVNYRDVLISMGITVLILGISAGLCLLLFGNLKQVSFLLLMLTSLSILASLIPSVQKLENTFEAGEYFLLIFCIAIGMLADFSEIQSAGLDVLFFTGIALFTTVFLHLLSAYFFKIERDLFLFTSVAALYGPAFIGQIASVTGNRRLIFSGISMGLLGYAIGNYLGIGLAYLLNSVL
jgi:uncharacterized membrane protein